MAFNDLTDSRSRDQYPVDDDQDGVFNGSDNENDGDVLDADGLPTPADISAGNHPADGYEDDAKGAGDDSLQALQDEDTEDDYTSDMTPQPQQASSDDDSDDGQDSGYDQTGANDNQDDDSGDAASQFQDAHAQAGPDAVRSTAAAHFGAADPQDFQDSVNQGVDSLPDHHVGGLAGTIMNALQGAGLPADQVAQEAGLSTNQPDQMGKGDLSGLLGYAQQYAPGALGDALANQPILSQALGNPMVKGLLGKLFG